MNLVCCGVVQTIVNEQLEDPDSKRHLVRGCSIMHPMFGVFLSRCFAFGAVLRRL